MDELIGRARRRTGPESLVGDLKERHLVGRAFGHPVEPGLLPPLRRCLQLSRPLLEVPRERDRPLDPLRIQNVHLVYPFEISPVTAAWTRPDGKKGHIGNQGYYG